jgi:hypothetical protein
VNEMPKYNRTRKMVLFDNFNEEEEAKKHPEPIAFTPDGERDQEIPPEVYVGSLVIPIDQVVGFEEPDLRGDFNDRTMRIRVMIRPPAKPEEQRGHVNIDTLNTVNRETFLHEVTHAIDWRQYPAHIMTEDQVNAISTALYEAMTNDDLCLNPEALKGRHGGCVELDENNVPDLQNCKMKLNQVELSMNIIDFNENNDEIGRFNRRKETISIADFRTADPLHQEMEIGLVEQWLNAVNKIKTLNLSKEKLSHMSLGIFDFLKQNPICFQKEKKKEKEKQD